MQIVKIKATSNGYTLLIGGKVVKSGLSTISAARDWLRSRYGNKFEAYAGAFRGTSGFDGQVILGQKNPKRIDMKYVNDYRPPWYKLGTYSSEGAARRAALDIRNEGVQHAHVALTFSGSDPYAVMLRDIQSTRSGVPKKRKPSKRRNMSQGITRGTGPTRVFHPIRSAPDYDPSLLRDSEGKKARKQKKQKKRGLKAIAKKRSLKVKTATKKRKAKKAVSLFGKKALPTSRRKNSVKKTKAKRSIPAAFKAAAERAKAMTPAQRAAWAKKMQAARKAKQKLKR